MSGNAEVAEQGIGHEGPVDRVLRHALLLRFGTVYVRPLFENRTANCPLRLIVDEELMDVRGDCGRRILLGSRRLREDKVLRNNETDEEQRKLERRLQNDEYKANAA